MRLAWPIGRVLLTTLLWAGLVGCSSSSGGPDAGGGAPDASDGGMDTSSGNDSSATDVASTDAGVDASPDGPGTAGCNSSVGEGGARFAYVAAASADQIFTYSVAANTGALTKTGSPVLTPSPRQVTVDPSNKFLLVAAFGDTQGTCATGCALVSYAIDQTSGALTPAGRGVAGTNPISLTINSSSTRVYTANTNSDDITIFALDPATGALTTSGTAAAGHFPEWITLSQDGKFLYVANSGSNNVSMYSVDTTTGALTSMGTVAAGTSPTFFIIHPNGKFAYTANPDSNNISLYGRDTTTGVLTPTIDISAGTTARSIAIEPTGHFAYVADQTQIMTFAVDATNGLMTSTGMPTLVSTGSQPYYLTTDPGGTHLYVGLANANTTATFAIDKTSGALCPVGGPVKAESNALNIALLP